MQITQHGDLIGGRGNEGTRRMCHFKPADGYIISARFRGVKTALSYVYLNEFFIGVIFLKIAVNGGVDRIDLGDPPIYGALRMRNGLGHNFG